ncbi:MAG: site-specific integrase [Acidobacteriia bacterium]|nr:site-specific integrase [Terriglobia bacterium]
MLYKQRKSTNWWYKFTWNSQLIRESTKQGNRRVAEQMEAARKTQLAKREVGIKDPLPVPTLQEFAEKQFLPFAEKQFAARPKTLGFYENGVKNLLAHKPLARLPLDAITTGNIATYAAARKEAGLAIASVNRELQVLRRMFRLAQEWRKVERLLARVSMVPKENHRERVLTDDEEAKYLGAATNIGEGIQEAYQRALCGIRAAQRGERPTEPRDPFLLRDVATTLLDCALRPEECFRLRWDQVRDGSLHILHGKTASARRVIPLSDRAAAVVEARRQGEQPSPWVFPAPTRSGHIEKSSLKKQHLRAIKESKVPAFVLYKCRHTCLTRWAEHMDPYTLAYLAGHSDFAMTKRYVHPQRETVRKAMAKVRGGHTSGHTTSKTASGE